MTGKPFHRVVQAELWKLFEPITRAKEPDNRAARESLLAAVGLDLDEHDDNDLLDAVKDTATAIDGTMKELDSAPEDLEDLSTYLEEIGDAIDSLSSLGDTTLFEEAANVGEQLFDFLLLSYLEREHPNFFYAIVALNMVELPDLGDPAVRREVDPATLPFYVAQHSDLHLGRLEDVLQEPGPVLEDAYLPEGEGASKDAARQVENRLFLLLQRIFGSIGFTVSYGMVGSDVDTDEDESDPRSRDEPFDDLSDLSIESRTMTVRREFGGKTLGFQLGVALHAGDGVPESDQRLAIAVAPFGDLSGSTTAGSYTVTLEVSSDLEMIVLSAEGLEHAESAGGAVDEVRTTAIVEKEPPKNSSSAYTVGPDDGTRLEVGAASVEGSVDVAEGEQTVYDVLAAARDSSFVVRPSGGFLEQILPEDGVSGEFDFGLGWRMAGGAGTPYVVGSGSLEATYPVDASIGEALTIRELFVAARVGQENLEGVEVELATTVDTELGPLSARVENVGLTAELTFPGGSEGNLGPLHADPSFKPPDGVAVSIDEGGVSGGGYLSFEDEKDRYAGPLQLQFEKVTLNAVGLLTTSFPDGSDGFSLLVIISGEFPPLQLGLGFWINGVGGLLGVNRSTEVDVLRQGVRDGSMNSVLFPEDPVANADRIVSDLRSIFPATRAQHVFGPMVKGGWGVPPVFTASLGVILELPSPTRLLILGRLQMQLPDPSEPLIDVKMNVLGTINFSEERAGVDASLYDSKIVQFPITGDMAMRTKWGDESLFLLSVGGWNPRFDAPEEFPVLDRVAIQLTTSDNPRARVEGYFAATSNTVQTGAKIEAHASAGGFGIDAKLGFDALIRFDPFEFFLDVVASLTIDTPLGSVGLDADATLSGPGPWRLKGKASFDLGFASPEVPFDVTFGEQTDEESMPDAEVHQTTATALSEPGNWSAQLPEQADSMVSLRDVDVAGGTVLAHPLGKLQVRQQVVPLGIQIERFGNARPADFTRFSIVELRVGGASGEAPDDEVREEFAPAQYLELSDEEKLTRPSYERYEAGVDVGADRVSYGDGDQTATQTLTYEESYVDREKGAYRESTGEGTIAVDTADALAEVSAVATSDARTTGRSAFAGPDQSVSVSDARYVVARTDASDTYTDGLQQVGDGDLPNEGTTYTEAEQALEAYLRERPATSRDAFQVIARHELAATGSEVDA
jgi:hypothetical protein